MGIPFNVRLKHFAAQMIRDGSEKAKMRATFTLVSIAK